MVVFMTMQDILYYIHTYGLIVLFLIVVGEYCVPAMPTGIVMPAAGIIAGQALNCRSSRKYNIIFVRLFCRINTFRKD